MYASFLERCSIDLLWLDEFMYYQTMGMSLNLVKGVSVEFFKDNSLVATADVERMSPTEFIFKETKLKNEFSEGKFDYTFTVRKDGVEKKRSGSAFVFIFRKENNDGHAHYDPKR